MSELKKIVSLGGVGCAFSYFIPLVLMLIGGLFSSFGLETFSIIFFSLGWPALAFGVSLLFLNATIYVPSVLWGGLGAGYLLMKDRHFGRRVLWAVMLVAIVGFPFMPVKLIFEATESHSLTWVTKPPRWHGSMRFIQSVSELTPCKYELLGWEDDSLYYHSDCSGTETIWRTSLAGNIEETTSLPTELYVETVSNEDTMAGIAAISEGNSLVAWRFEGMETADSQHYATIVNELFGPEDVVIISRE